MKSFEHPTLQFVQIKAQVLKRKERLRHHHPDWTDKQIDTIGDYDFFFSQWKVRFRQNIPFSILASLGTLTLFKNVIWFEPTLAWYLSQWSDVAVNLFKIATLGVFEWLGIHIPAWLVQYLTIGIGMTGIACRVINDFQIIKASAFDDPFQHQQLTSGCTGCFMQVVMVPFTAPFWPLFILVPLVTIRSSSLRREWEVTRSQMVKIQLKRAIMYTEPFLISSLIWLAFALFS